MITRFSFRPDPEGSVRSFLQVEWLVDKMLGVLFAYISLVPFYYMEEQRLAADIPALSLVKYLPFVFVVLALGLWLVEWVGRKRPFVASPVFAFMCLYLCVSLVSLWGAEYVQKGLAKWIYYSATGCGLAFLIVQYGQNLAHRLAGYMALISGTVVLYTCAIALLGEDPVWGEVQRSFNPYYTQERVSGPFSHTVATATYTMFLFPLALWRLSVLRRIEFRFLWGGICALYLPVVLLTQTRGAVVAAFVSIVLMAPWLKKALAAAVRISRKELFFGLVVIVTVCSALGIAFDFDRWIGERLAQIGERWRHISETIPVTVESEHKVYTYNSLLEYTERFRVAQYRTVGNILAEHPLLGVGFGTFSLAFDKYKYTENYIEREFNFHTAENMYLMVLAETGWIGFSSWMLLMGAVVVWVFRAYRREPEGEQRYLMLAYLAATGGLSINLLTWDILNDPTLRMSYWMFSGLALACCVQHNVAPERPLQTEKGAGDGMGRSASDPRAGQSTCA